MKFEDGYLFLTLQERLVNYLGIAAVREELHPILVNLVANSVLGSLVVLLPGARGLRIAFTLAEIMDY